MNNPNYDIDDLLKDAAAHYPLKEPDDEWKAIAGRLGNAYLIPVADSKRKNGSRRFFPLLLLLLLSTTAIIFIKWNKDKVTIGTGVAESPVAGHEKKPGQAGMHSPFIRQQLETADHFNLPVQGSGGNASRTSTPLWQPESAITKLLPGIDETGGMPELPEVIPTILESPVKSPPHRMQSDIAPPDKQARNTENRGFYFGIAGGPALSKVRDDGFHRTGYHAGLFVGYRFSRKWSLETGMLFSQKHYWVQKKNFDTKQFNATMPQGMELLEVHGSNCLLQVPLHVRYDFLEKKKYRFFAAAGVSSSLMVAEHNNYTTRYNGGIDKINVNYKQNKPYFASSVDLRAGVEYSLNNRFGIRLGPYYQIPSKDLGVGQVPITTVGIRLGIVRLPATNNRK